MKKSRFGNIELISLIFIGLACIAGFAAIQFWDKGKDAGVSFKSNDECFFRLFANQFTPEDYKFTSLDAYYLKDTDKYYYNAKYTLYISTEGEWFDIDDVYVGKKGQINSSFCLSWDDLNGYEEAAKEFERAKSEGVHRTYTTGEIQSSLEEAFNEEE